MQGLLIYFLIYNFRGYEIQMNKDVCNIVYKEAAQCTQCIGPFGGCGSQRKKSSPRPALHGHLDL